MEVKLTENCNITVDDVKRVLIESDSVLQKILTIVLSDD